jgi:hypothetical protein
LALIAIAFPLTLHTRDVLRNEAFVRNVTSEVEKWDPQAAIVHIDASLEGDRGAVSMTIATTADRQPAWRLARSITMAHGIDVDLAINYQQETTDAASTN